jgi:hypothetical protein
VLVAADLGWLVDGFEIFALFLTVGFALRQLLDAAHYADIPNMLVSYSRPPSSAGPRQ